MGATIRTAGLLLATLGALVGAGATRAAAEPPRGPHHEGPPGFDRMLERDADRLGLDAETRAHVREIADAARAAAEPLEEQRRALRERMRALLDQDAPDVDAVMRLADQMGAVDTELRKRHLRTLLDIRALLTPAQREELVRIHGERRGPRARRPRDAAPEAPPPAEP